LKTADDFNGQVSSLLTTARDTWGSAAIEPQLVKLLAFMETHHDLRDFVVAKLVGLTERDDAYLRLARPGVVELLEFTMHRLRWQEIQDALRAIDQPGADLRERQSASRVLDAYSDEWSNADIYDTYRVD
jgi:hypothetical protein